MVPLGISPRIPSRNFPGVPSGDSFLTQELEFSDGTPWGISNYELLRRLLLGIPVLSRDPFKKFVLGIPPRVTYRNISRSSLCRFCGVPCEDFFSSWFQSFFGDFSISSFDRLLLKFVLWILTEITFSDSFKSSFWIFLQNLIHDIPSEVHSMHSRRNPKRKILDEFPNVTPGRICRRNFGWNFPGESIERPPLEIPRANS